MVWCHCVINLLCSCFYAQSNMFTGTYQVNMQMRLSWKFAILLIILMKIIYTKYLVYITQHRYCLYYRSYDTVPYRLVPYSRLNDTHNIPKSLLIQQLYSLVWSPRLLPYETSAYSVAVVRSLTKSGPLPYFNKNVIYQQLRQSWLLFEDYFVMFTPIKIRKESDL